VTETKNPQNTQSMVTAEDGRFQFQVGAGKYSLQGLKRGFLTFAYEQHENFWTGIVTGAGLDTENLILRLPPTAMIGGKVTDEIGEPVRGATITIFSGEPLCWCKSRRDQCQCLPPTTRVLTKQTPWELERISYP